MVDFALPLNNRPEESFTLPSYYYCNPDIFELEKERIFYRTWQYIAHQSLLAKPGDYVAARICDQNIFAIHGNDGEIRAFYNVCQHRAHELLPEGTGNVLRTIACPYHAWTYDRNGKLRGAPLSNRRTGFSTEDYSLKEVSIEKFLNCFFINLDPDAPYLADIAGGLEADVRNRIPFYDEMTVPRVSYDESAKIKAGWKVVVDNFVECYHCDHAHPDFASLICMDNYKHDTFDIWSRQIGEELRTENSAYPLDPKTDFMMSAFWYLWPNTTFNILPGKHEINISTIRPTGLETTSFEGHTISSSQIYDQHRSDYVNNTLVVEDVVLCESVQRGLKSRGYSQGPIMSGPTGTGRGEHAIHHFHQMIMRALN